MPNKKEDIICPTCHKKGTWTDLNSFRPFCSDRCKLTDLGEWASESRRIAGDDISPENINSPDSED